MRIKIVQKHKSINPPCEFELPAFSVLTGKNGSGKTHLLEAIADRNKSEVYLDSRRVKYVRYIPFNGLNPSIVEKCDPQTMAADIKKVWTQYEAELQRHRSRDRNNENPSALLDYIHNNTTLKAFIKRTSEATEKPVDELTEDDFGDNFDAYLSGEKDFFRGQFASIFKNYHQRQEENNFNEYYRSKHMPVTKPVLNQSEFQEKFGIPPWDFVNSILLETKMPYEVNNPVGSRIDSTYTFKLLDRVGGFEISSVDLSTGEKVLMSLALAIYNTVGDIIKPDILLLDEPDAGLHPSLSKMMVDVINKNIVTNNNIPTVISTHSPTTIIASEGISVYQMIRGNSAPAKIPVQQAVEILSSDIPFLKISNEKRRQVFVESKYDVNYYELLTNIYSRLETLPAEPIFLAARTSNGSNCQDVVEIVSSLYRHGNEQVYGIIDWDTNNKSKDRIIVIGENDRYSIENYLLDPLLMGLLFIREGKMNFTDFGIHSLVSYSEVGKLTENECQLIIAKVLFDLGLDSMNQVKSKLQNGGIVSTSAEFNLYQGHDLEKLYKTKYPFLNSYKNEDGLKKDVVQKVINDYPYLVPMKVFDVIKMIK